MRTCSVCNQNLGDAPFTKHSRAKCKKCYARKQMEWQRANSLRANACAKKYRDTKFNKKILLAIAPGKKRCLACMQCFDSNNFYTLGKHVKKIRYMPKCKGCAKLERLNNVEMRLAANSRSRIKCAIKNNQKKGFAVSALGCSIFELKKPLERMFYPHLEAGEMRSWVNYGYYGWHIDHIRPLRSFNLENRYEFLAACKYSNLQPLWANDNFKKSGGQ